MATVLLAPPATPAPPVEAPAEPCHCGRPIPPGRRAYCSWRCRFEDDDHGPDTPNPDAEGDDQ